MNEKQQPTPKSSPIMKWGPPALVFLAVVWLYMPKINTRVEPALGEKVQFTLQPLLGTKQGVDDKSLQGQVVLINFWGTWCPPCRAEFPHMVEIAKKFADKPRFSFVSVSCDEVPIEKLAQETAQFMKRKKADFPVYHDLSTYTRRELSDVAKLDSFVYPTTILLDGDGTIRGFWRGFAQEEMKEIEQRISKLLDS